MTKIFINLDGGMIQNIISDAPVEVMVVDYDIDGASDVVRFEDERGNTAMAFVQHDVSTRDGVINLDPELTNRMYSNVVKGLKDA